MKKLIGMNCAWKYELKGVLLVINASKPIKPL
jgi:hypothetical protein